MNINQQQVIVLMLGHRSLAGKDTFANFLVEEFNYSRFAFADKLKCVVKDLYDLSDFQVFGENKDIPDGRYLNNIDVERGFLTPRKILQRFGQDQRRIYPDIWGEYVFRQIDNFITISKRTEEILNYLFVITDFRFKNEYNIGLNWFNRKIDNVNKIKPITIKIDRPNVYARSGKNDISETELNNFEFDYIIKNNSDLRDLKFKAIEFHLNTITKNYICCNNV